jgi:hypothetical protein
MSSDEVWHTTLFRTLMVLPMGPYVKLPSTGSICMQMLDGIQAMLLKHVEGRSSSLQEMYVEASFGSW